LNLIPDIFICLFVSVSVFITFTLTPVVFKFIFVITGSPALNNPSFCDDGLSPTNIIVVFASYPFFISVIVELSNFLAVIYNLLFSILTSLPPLSYTSNWLNILLLSSSVISFPSCVSIVSPLNDGLL